MRTTGWSSCGARRARCWRACSTWAGVAPSSHAPSATSSCAPAWPDWSSSTSGIRPSTSAASTGSPSPATAPRWASRSTSAAWPSRGPDHEPLVVDWRAPVAEPFYRATGLDPQGLARRRHLAVRGRSVLGLEDEYFVDPDGRPTTVIVDREGEACRARPRRRAPALRRDGARRPGRAALRPRPGPHGAYGRHHRDHPARAGRDHPLAARRRPDRPGRPRYGQDGGGAAPRRLSPLYPPLPARAPRSARGRAQPALPALHRTGASLARGDRRQPLDRVGTGARGPCARCRRFGGGQAQGRRAHGQGAGPGRAHAAAPAAPRHRGALRCGRAAPARLEHRGDRCPGPAPPWYPQRAPPLRRIPGPARPGRRLRGPAWPGAAWTSGRRGRARRSRTTWPGGCAACPRCPRRSIACGPGSRPTSSSTTCSGPGRSSLPPAKASSIRPRWRASTAPAARRSTPCRGRRGIPPSSTRPARCSARAGAAGPPGPGCSGWTTPRRTRWGSGRRAWPSRPCRQPPF